jgi:hypothetical protein
MILALPQVFPPRLKRVRFAAENLTLTSEDGLHRPIGLHKSFPIKEDESTQEIINQGKKNSNIDFL